MPPTREQLEDAYKTERRCDKAAAVVGISPTHFKRLMRQHSIPFLPRDQQLGRCNAWNPVPSRELAYVLGVLLGDGYVSGKKRDRGNSYRIALRVTDRVFAEKFRDSLRVFGIVTETRPIAQDPRPNRSPMFETRASSKLFAEWYRSLTLPQVREWCIGCEAGLVCGLWESEGHVIPESSGGFDVTIGMTREDIIDMLVEIFTEWGLHPKKLGPYKDRRGAKDIYRVNLYRHAEVAEFIRRADPCIRRGTMVIPSQAGDEDVSGRV